LPFIGPAVRRVDGPSRPPRPRQTVEVDSSSRDVVFERRHVFHRGDDSGGNCRWGVASGSVGGCFADDVEAAIAPRISPLVVLRSHGRSRWFGPCPTCITIDHGGRRCESVHANPASPCEPIAAATAFRDTPRNALNSVSIAVDIAGDTDHSWGATNRSPGARNLQRCTRPREHEVLFVHFG
jgi:hypothetical protein